MQEFIIDEEYSGVRVDRYLRKKLKNIYLSDIYKMIRKSMIKINGKKIKQDTRLNKGDILQLYFKINKEEFDDANINNNFISLNLDRINKLKTMIVFENNDLFIINKVSGDIIHRGSGHDISLLEEFRAYFKNMSINFVNRIDKATSGLVIAAKNIKTARKLAEYIRDKKIEKKYYILVESRVKEDNFTIENYLKKEEEKVMVSDVEKEGYKKSTTHFKKIAITDNYSLLEAKLKTGRTHQLRAQLAHIGHPIVGDIKYNNKNDNENYMFLFSHYLSIPDENIEIDLKIPQVFLNKINN